VRSRFDRRVISEQALAFIRACQERVPCHLAGGVAVAGTILGHRLSRDIDLFVHDREAHRELVDALAEVSQRVGSSVQILRDGGNHVRARIDFGGDRLELDVVHEALPDLDAAVEVESILIESERDLHASKITCLLSRSEPRDLVDLLFWERAGRPPEAQLEHALKKDAGIDPGVLAWLLRSFPVEPLPSMLAALTVEELQSYRNELAQRFKQLALSGT
jgi:hypothetical protein